MRLEDAKLMSGAVDDSSGLIFINNTKADVRNAIYNVSASSIRGVL